MVECRDGNTQRKNKDENQAIQQKTETPAVDPAHGFFLLSFPCILCAYGRAMSRGGGERQAFFLRYDIFRPGASSGISVNYVFFFERRGGNPILQPASARSGNSAARSRRPVIETSRGRKLQADQPPATDHQPPTEGRQQTEEEHRAPAPGLCRQGDQPPATVPGPRQLSSAFISASGEGDSKRMLSVEKARVRASSRRLFPSAGWTQSGQTSAAG